jgi:hypothetical protein
LTQLLRKIGRQRPLGEDMESQRFGGMDRARRSLGRQGTRGLLARVIAAFAALAILAHSRTCLAYGMITNKFSEYALSSALSPDEIYTIVLLIDYVEYDLDPKYPTSMTPRNPSIGATQIRTKALLVRN